MNLSNDMISKFVKITHDGNTKNTKNTETTVYGTAVSYGDKIYVRLDGSELLTPVETTADISPGERVTVLIKNHTATVDGNISAPSTNSEAVKKQTEEVSEELKTDIQVLDESIFRRVGDLKNGMSEIKQTADKIEWVVEKGDSKSSMVLTDELYSLVAKNITLSAEHIDLHGYITANEGFSINEDGSITATAGKISGYTIEGDTLIGNNVGMCGSSAENIAFWAGSDISDEASFQVFHDGKVIASDLQLNGGDININNKFHVDSKGTLTTEDIIYANGGIYSKGDFVGKGYGASLYSDSAKGEGHTYVRSLNNGIKLRCAADEEVHCGVEGDDEKYVNLRAKNIYASEKVYSEGSVVTSDRARKRDLELYSVDAIKEVCSTPVYAYHLDVDLDEELKRIGIIMQEAPVDTIDISGKGVDLYQMTTMLWRAVQQQQDLIDILTKRIDEIENR